MGISSYQDGFEKGDCDMIPDKKDVLVRYRLEQSKESLGDAKSLLSSGSFRGSVNRAYYALFYSVLSSRFNPSSNLFGSGILGIVEGREPDAKPHTYDTTIS